MNTVCVIHYDTSSSSAGRKNSWRRRRRSVHWNVHEHPGVRCSQPLLYLLWVVQTKHWFKWTSSRRLTLVDELCGCRFAAFCRRSLDEPPFRRWLCLDTRESIKGSQSSFFETFRKNWRSFLDVDVQFSQIELFMNVWLYFLGRAMVTLANLRPSFPPIDKSLTRISERTDICYLCHFFWSVLRQKKPSEGQTEPAAPPPPSQTKALKQVFSDLPPVLWRLCQVQALKATLLRLQEDCLHGSKKPTVGNWQVRPLC